MYDDDDDDGDDDGSWWCWHSSHSNTPLFWYWILKFPAQPSSTPSSTPAFNTRIVL